MKSYTDLEQSKMLAEILSIESADMCLTFVNNIWNPVWGKTDDIYKLQKDCYEPDYTKDEYVDFDEFEPKVVPCWSLAALLGVLPNKLQIALAINDFQGDRKEKYAIGSVEHDKYDCFADNPIDACYEMILKLHELKML